MTNDDQSLDQFRPRKMMASGHTRPAMEIVYGGPLDWRAVSADKNFFMHLMPNNQFKEDLVIDIIALNGKFDSRAVVEAIDRSNGRVTFRTLYLYEAEPVPPERLSAGGLVVQWRGKDGGKWCIGLSGADEASPIVANLATERLAADHLAKLMANKGPAKSKADKRAA